MTNPPARPWLMAVLMLASIALVAFGALAQTVLVPAEVTPGVSAWAYIRGLSLFIGLAAAVGVVKLAVAWRDGGLTAAWAVTTFLMTLIVGFAATAIAVEYFESAGYRITAVIASALGAEKLWELTLLAWDRVRPAHLLSTLRGGKP
ncbi:MAG TPA: hypothetical protein VMT16_09900 [Thermoanaerobaculia bacterium]|nr:hypothetical protein [Thermoanaerobaculia bacterium]